MNDADAIVVQVDKDLENLIPEFFATRRADVESIQGALLSGDFETVRILGHSMKGSGGGYGFDDISVIGAVLEQAAKQQDETAIRSGVGKLVFYLDKVKVVYEEL
jgi:HPt (histidine-containing phosphotransfer) domain-containing protein